MSWLRPVLLGLLLAIAPVAWAVNPDEMLADPALEQRARDISGELRCLVCQNESIDDSDADLAKDIRVLVRERLTAGDTDDQVRQFLVDRYGEFVLLRPRVEGHTLLLWFAAPGLLVIGLIVLFVMALRRRRPVAVDELSAEEQKALDSLRGDRP
ncbi:MAG: cytochrome c-type biosis protein CcmH [Devosia sp.]|uniref:cytochrome c-type biogenesis protein n=1 Tax=Devosia sp. TaxID=1871048 RepID=UPI002631C3A2|nr:cytochrome c-type biogenesis protein [Devosia sp.]MDB5530538.1 cytochrome c-type biosis protein CcmH [Devosia sp.]